MDALGIAEEDDQDRARAVYLMSVATWDIVEGHVIDRLREMESGSVQCCVTSPPYYGLRDYGLEPSIWGDLWIGCLGLEPTPDQFVAHLVEVFAEVRRVLRDDGTLWLNMGDSYAGSWGAQSRGGPPSESSTLRGNGHVGGGPKIKSLSAVQIAAHPKGTRTGSIPAGADYKPKDLIGVPWMLAFALRADGWYLRSDIIWHKPNPMPSSVRDRLTSSHEHIFLLTKSKRYFYDADAVREADSGSDHPRKILNGQASLEPTGGLMPAHSGLRKAEGRIGNGRNRRDVWSVPEELWSQFLRWVEEQPEGSKADVWRVGTRPFPGAHFATFPPNLIEPCILAGSAEMACGECGAPWRRVVERTPMVVREGPGRQGTRDASGNASGSRTAFTGTMLKPATTTIGFESSCEHDDGSSTSLVLDPFAGAGTTGLVAHRHGRSFVGIELSPDFAEMARDRIMAEVVVT